MNVITKKFIIIFLGFLILRFNISSYARIHIPNPNATPLWPVAGHPKVNSNFGVLTDPASGFAFHDHIDIYAPAGTPVVAVVSGKVVYGESALSSITILGNDGNYYSYGSLRMIPKKFSDIKYGTPPVPVEKGEEIGVVSDRGSVELIDDHIEFIISGDYPDIPGHFTTETSLESDNPLLLTYQIWEGEPSNVIGTTRDPANNKPVIEEFVFKNHNTGEILGRTLPNNTVPIIIYGNVDIIAKSYDIMYPLDGTTIQRPGIPWRISYFVKGKANIGSETSPWTLVRFNSYENIHQQAYQDFMTVIYDIEEGKPHAGYDYWHFIVSHVDKDGKIDANQYWNTNAHFDCPTGNGVCSPELDAKTQSEVKFPDGLYEVGIIAEELAGNDYFSGENLKNVYKNFAN